MKFHNFFYFFGSFLPSWIRIRILNSYGTQTILTLSLESASAVVVVQFFRMNRSLRTFLFLGSRTAAPAPASGGCDWLVRLMMTGRSGGGAAAEVGVRSACCCCSSCCCWLVTSSALLTTTTGFILRYLRTALPSLCQSINSIWKEWNEMELVHRLSKSWNPMALLW